MSARPTKLFVMALGDGVILEADTRAGLDQLYRQHVGECAHDWQRTPSRALEACSKCRTLRHTAFVRRRP